MIINAAELVHELLFICTILIILIVHIQVDKYNLVSNGLIGSGSVILWHEKKIKLNSLKIKTFLECYSKFKLLKIKILNNVLVSAEFQILSDFNYDRTGHEGMNWYETITSMAINLTCIS